MSTSSSAGAGGGASPSFRSSTAPHAWQSSARTAGDSASGGRREADAEGFELRRHPRRQEPDPLEVPHERGVQVAAEELPERRLVAAGGAVLPQALDLVDVGPGESDLL